MESWISLVRMASIGTARTGTELSALDYADCPDGLRPVLTAESGEVPAKRLLRNAALLTVLRRAGFRQPPLTAGMTENGIGNPSSAETRPVCSPAAAARLVVILGSRRHLLREWLELLDLAAARIPEGLLPEMLEVGLEQPSLRELLCRLIGERGRWLAAFDPRWAWADDGLQTGPCPSPDAPSSTIPAGLPQLLLSLLSLHTKVPERTTIEIRQPNRQEQEELERYAAQCAPLDPEGEGSIYLDSPFARLLATLHPSILAEAWSADLSRPEKIVRAAARSIEREMLLAALSVAAARSCAVDWIEPLIAERLSEPTEEGLGIFHLLPAERQEHWIIHALRQSLNLEVDQPAFWLLTRSTGVWGRRIADRLWPVMLRELQSRTTTVTWDWRLLISQAARQLDPQLADEATDFFADAVRISSPLVPDLVILLDDLVFRAAMANELRQ